MLRGRQLGLTALDDRRVSPSCRSRDLRARTPTALSRARAQALPYGGAHECRAARAGTILVGPQEERDEAWVVGGRLTFERPAHAGAGEVESVSGYVLPGLVDAHCHVGLDAHGAVDRETAIEQASTDRDAGALLIRDAGSPLDTRFVDEHEELPKIIRAGRHIARQRRYIPNVGEEIEPDELVSMVRVQARRETVGSSSSETGSTATPVTCGRAGRSRR